ALPSADSLKWEYRVGDSPVDKSGLPVWINDKSSSGSWLPCSVPQAGMSNISDNYLWIKTTLADYKLQEPAIFLYTYDKVFELYLDDKLLCKFGDFKTANDKYSPGSSWHIITLPADYAGKTVYLRMYSLNKYGTGILGDFNIGPKSSFLEKILKQDIDTVLLSGIFAFVGICSILISLINKLRANKKSLLYLGLFSIFTGIWLISNTSIKQYFLDAPVLWLYISSSALYLIPVWFCLFLKSILSGKFSSLINLLAGTTLTFSLFSITGSVLRLFSIYNTMKYFHILLISMIVVITFITVKSLFKGTRTERTFGVNLVLLYVFAAIDLIRWYTVITVDFDFVTQWGMLLFIVSMAFSIIRQLSESEIKLKLYSEEIKLKEEILEEKKKLLTEMSNYDMMKTEFFVNISHELRTPLNIILSTLQLINLYMDKGQVSSDEIELPKHLQVMKQNCYRLIRLVNNIIDISKIDSGYMEPTFHNHDIVAAVEDTALSAADYISSNGIDLYFDTDIEEKHMCFDKEKIERIMLNLLSNAVKFSKPGSTIAVELKDMGDSVSISVKDTGIGIHKDKLQVIFERFVQVDKSLTRSQEGSGIGLSLVKALVEMHKGTITVESEYGKGTTFIIALPSTLPETRKEESQKLKLPSAPVEKVYIEFSDI
ncbi:MAG: sensor histidine kinase, partial [Bacillota bacterium]|nr:sensor histidine kinase [Bacillota bacterium]